MSANLIEERRLSETKRFRREPSKPERFRLSQTVVNRRERVEPIRQYSIPPVTEDEETNVIKKAVIWMVVLAVTPLILFHVITFFYPDIFMIPVAP